MTTATGEFSPAQERIARRVVIVSALSLFIIFGIRLSFSVFFAEFVAAEGWSSEAAASIFSVSMVVFALGSTPAGLLLDRFGPRFVFGLGAIFLSGGLFLSSQSQSVLQLTLSYGLLGGTGLALFGLGPFAAVVSGWVPPARRGRAIGLVFAGTGFGALLFVPLCSWLIDTFEWRNAYLILTLICLLILAPLLIFGQATPPRTPAQPGKSALPRPHKAWTELLTNLRFWALMIVSLTAMGPLRSLTVHQVAYMESVGVSREVASGFVGLAGLLTAGTYIGWGVISDRFGRAWAFTLGALCLMGAVGVLILLKTSHGYGLLMFYALLMALGEGTRSSQSTALASDIFQDYGLGMINGIVGAMFGLGAAFGPWIVGRLRDNTGSYDPGLGAVLIMVVISILAFLFISFMSNQRHAD